MFWDKKKEKPEIPDTYIVERVKPEAEKGTVTLVTQECPFCKERHTVRYNKDSISKFRDYLPEGEYLTAVFVCPITRDKYEGRIYV
jgi:hypothetical protein